MMIMLSQQMRRHQMLNSALGRQRNAKPWNSLQISTTKLELRMSEAPRISRHRQLLRWASILLINPSAPTGVSRYARTSRKHADCSWREMLAPQSAAQGNTTARRTKTRDVNRVNEHAIKIVLIRYVLIKLALSVSAWVFRRMSDQTNV